MARVSASHTRVGLGLDLVWGRAQVGHRGIAQRSGALVDVGVEAAAELVEVWRRLERYTSSI